RARLLRRLEDEPGGDVQALGVVERRLAKMLRQVHEAAGAVRRVELVLATARPVVGARIHGQRVVVRGELDTPAPADGPQRRQGAESLGRRWQGAALEREKVLPAEAARIDRERRRDGLVALDLLPRDAQRDRLGRDRDDLERSRGDDVEAEDAVRERGAAELG